MSSSSNTINKHTSSIRVVVLGCGIMGSGIAQSFMNNPQISLTIIEQYPERQIPFFFSGETVNSLISNHGVKIFKRVKDMTKKQSVEEQKDGSENLHEIPDIIIEAVPERMELKRSVYRELEETFGGDFLLASNTSTLDLNELASKLKWQDRLDKDLMFVF